MSNSTKPTLFSDKPVKSVKMLHAIKTNKPCKRKVFTFWNVLAMISCVFALVSVCYNFFK